MKNKTKSKIKAIVAVVIVLVMLLLVILPLFSGTVQAATEKELKQKQEELQKKIDAEEEKKDEVATEKEKLDHQITALHSEISVLNDNISKLDSEIGKKQAELEAAEAKVNMQDDLFKKRIQVMSEQGNWNYIEILFSSSSINDFFSNYEIMTELLSYDKNLLNTMKEAKQVIADSKASIESNKAEVTADKDELASKKSNLSYLSNQRQQQINNITANVEEYQKQYEAAERAMNALKSQLSGSLSSSNGSVKYVGGTFTWPIPGYSNITSQYGYRLHPVLKVNKLHTGVDISAPTGAQVVAANGGTVTKAYYNSAYGNMVVIDHGGGYATLYAHASALLVSSGQKVSKGQAIMKVGSTGNSTGPHLHFEVLINGATSNPMNQFSAR
ncbi:MAG: peptidoglycan DD-metalloendopeptidase family protein [Clostridiales bacterium]|jgi:murein DD-endopeptidase MepM/ murein hydrolase activator NlpD|nr:peptidoglycan DD-metalloendopeptidase family protein [Clostridiales bacterium]